MAVREADRKRKSPPSAGVHTAQDHVRNPCLRGTLLDACKTSREGIMKFSIPSILISAALLAGSTSIVRADTAPTIIRHLVYDFSYDRRANAVLPVGAIGSGAFNPVAFSA